MIPFPDFEQHIQIAQQNLDLIQDLIHQECIDSSQSTPELPIEMLCQLSIALEELHIAQEELQCQNEELLASRQELEQQRQRYQELFEFAPDGYLVTDTKGIIQEANKALVTQLGVRRQYLLGKPIIVFVSQADRHAFRGLLNLVVQKGEVKDWAIKLQPRQGKPFPAETSITSQKDNQGNVVGLLWSIRNPSQRLLAAEQKIRDQAALLELATDGIFIRDLSQKISFWNRGAEKLYGWKAEEIIGQSYYDTIGQKVTPQLLEAEKTVMEKGEWQGELNTITKCGQALVVESRWTLVRDRKENPRAILIDDTELTEKKTLEAQFDHDQPLARLKRNISYPQS